MALFNQVGSILKQSISQNSASSMLNSVRYMSTKLFVRGFSFGTDDKSLEKAFSQYGEVVSARVIVDRDTGRSSGLGIVEFDDDECAQSALSGMDGKVLQERTIHVSLADERRPGGGGYGGGSGGGGSRSRRRYIGGGGPDGYGGAYDGFTTFHC